jgi:hypothetical protein
LSVQQTLEEYCDTIFLVIFSFVYCYCVFVFPFAFNREVNLYGYYWIGLLTSLNLVCIAALVLFSVKKSNVILISALLFLTWVFFNSLRLGNEYTIIVYSLMIQVIIFRHIQLSKLLRLWYLIFGICLIQLMWSISPMLGLSEKKGFFQLVGTFHNSGVFANYVVLHVPILHYLLFGNTHEQDKSKAKRILALKSVLFCAFVGINIVISTFSKSRTSMLTLALIILILAYPLFKNTLRKWTLTTKMIVSAFFMISASIIFIWLFFLKEGSSWGRLLMLEVAFQHIFDHFWSGVGLDNFTWYYPQWQSQYFREHTGFSNYFLNAGETYLIFSEILQLFMSLGFFLFILLGIVFFRMFIKTSKNVSLMQSLRAVIASILSTALTHYPLHINAMLMVLGLGCSLAWRSRSSALDILPSYKFFISLQKFQQYLLLGCSVAVLYVAIGMCMSVIEWNVVKASYAMQTGAQKVKLVSIYHTLHDDSRFLVDYANFLIERDADKRMICEILEQSKLRFISKESSETLAYLYLETGQNAMAIKEFRWLINFLPSRFGYRLELLRLYMKTDQNELARDLALTILNMPVKVPSKEVEQIKCETRSIYDNLSKSY